jgi:hypothetical protein
MSQHSVCNFCRQNILQADVSWAYHHPSFLSLKSAAQRLCVFCRLLYGDVFSQFSKLNDFCAKDTSNDQALKHWLHDDVQQLEKLPFGHGLKATSLYRWSTRRLGRTRESNVTVVITFRAISRALEIDVGTPSPTEAKGYNLPERIFYCFPEADLGFLLSPAELGPSTSPEVNDGVQIKRWIRQCGIEHKHCPKRAGAGGKFVPTRLLHIGGKRRGQPIRVVDTKSNNIKGPYVTLSHCWGESQDERRDSLTTKTRDEFMGDGVPWEYLSRNFRQAIEVARFLEIDYIWIDSRKFISTKEYELS